MTKVHIYIGLNKNVGTVFLWLPMACTKNSYLLSDAFFIFLKKYVQVQLLKINFSFDIYEVWF